MQRGLLVEFSCNSPIRYLIALLRALLIVRLFVLEWRVVATTVELDNPLEDSAFRGLLILIHPQPKGSTAF